jgi:hypothetical protein
VGSKKPAGSAVYFQRLDSKARPLGEIVKVTDDEPMACGRPSVAWGETGYAVTWHDSRFYEGAEIFFSFLQCSGKTDDIKDTDISPVNDTGSDNSGPDNSDKHSVPQDQLKSVF